MRKFLIRLSLFVGIVVIVDYCFGRAMDFMYAHAKGGDIKEMNDVCVNNEYDIIVMGSSRAHHHYVPQIITDSLGLTCYNAGRDGNGIILMYGFYEMITERYTPKLILYDISQGFDIYENPADQNDSRYLSLLKPYVKRPNIDGIFKSLSWQEWVKTYSSLYRYNSMSLSIIKNYLSCSPYNVDGYARLSGKMNYEPIVSGNKSFEVEDSLKLYYFERFIESNKEHNIPLVVVISPIYGAKNDDYLYTKIVDLCRIHEIPLLDYHGDSRFVTIKDYFKDTTHLNDSGAKVFTSVLINDIKELIEI